MDNNGKIDIIIPAYKAQKTILRTLASIAEQTILSDLNVVIVNDCCPNGTYKKYVDMFKPYMSIREIRLKENGGPGVARQKGIEATTNEFFTCIDADDTFASTIALETLRTSIIEPVNCGNGDFINKGFKCVSSVFMQLGEDLKHIVPHQNDMVWMFGKLYRREFIEHYNIHFNETRANEDTGFNTWVKLLCDNPREQIRYIPETTYFWHNKKDSITRINNGQYGFDQCLCGWTDNMIYAIQNAKKSRPFSGNVSQWIVNVMMELYYYYVECYAKQPIFAEQAWEYVKKFYHTCYKRIEDDISEQVFSEMFSMSSMGKHQSGHLIGMIPHIGIKEFMDKLHEESYDPNHIYDVWEKMKESDEGKQLIQNNITCGVCAEGYTNRPEEILKDSKYGVRK